ncbi:thiolase family protein [Nakamurella deserti]|uniref:thiolase family protein n=1 Tax=Nakamurella deserti TaxID=2164074 RepID=UPI000DBE9117|nr:thiolase family protein [Nakamurella deserti]
MAARRTPIGTAGHALAGVTVDRLAAPVLRVLADDPLLGPVDDVLLGNCLGPGGNPARLAALGAGLGTATPAVTVDRQCGSGLDAILQGAARIAAGQAGVVLAGGAESASTAPVRARRDTGQTYARAPFAPAGFPDPDMGPAADALAAHLGIGRADHDAWAARSFERAQRACERGAFAAEWVPLPGLDHDERVRPGVTTARLARLRPAFGPDGTHTAGNSCGISDGAAAVALTSPDAARGRPHLRILGGAVRGCDPALPGLGPTAAVPPLLERLGLGVAELGAVEITEAFAAQILAAVRTLDLDPDTVCTDGGAIAMGHPWGASGAVLVVRLFARMLQPGGPEFGLAACAIGGGQGIALVVQRVAP